MNSRLKRTDLIVCYVGLLAFCMLVNNLGDFNRHQGFFDTCSKVCSVLAIIASVSYFINVYRDKKKEKIV